jgi:inosose dehydratase
MTQILGRPMLRRQLLKSGAFAFAVPALTSMPFSSQVSASSEEADPWLGLKAGVATYTLRELPIEEAIKATQRVGLKYVSIKNVKNHIDLSHSR